MNRLARKIVVFTMAVVTCIGIAGCEDKDIVDYSQAANWAVCENTSADPSMENKTADVFFVCPTAVGGDENTLNMNMADEKSRKGFLGAVLMEKGIYDDNARFFAPYYRQATLQVYMLPTEQQTAPLDYAYEDIRVAFEYYLSNYNDDRPIILAGFSQGGDMVKRLMMEYGRDKSFNDKLIAAYVIGWNVTDEDLAAYPYIRMAEGEADTDVIVSFCSESEELTESAIVPTNTNSINPLNWMYDSTEADKSLNIGACFVDGTGAILTEIPEFTGAYIDSDRGTLKVPDVVKEDYPAKLAFLDEGNYHIYDYMFFYRNLEKNVQTRIDQYESLSRIRKSVFKQNTLGKFRALFPDSAASGESGKITANVDLAQKVTAEIALAGSEDYDYCDELQNSSVRMNEALVILWESSDKQWYYVATPFCLGWVKQSDVGITEDYDYWMEALNPEDFLVVTDNHTYLDEDPSNALISARALDMGTKLALVTDDSYESNNYGRHALNNYKIKYVKQYAYLYCTNV